MGPDRARDPDEVGAGPRELPAVLERRVAVDQAGQHEQAAPPCDQLDQRGVGRRSAPTVGSAERDIVGAGFAGNHRRMREPPQDAPRMRPGPSAARAAGHSLGPAEVDPVGAGLARQIDVVLEQKGDPAGGAHRSQLRGRGHEGSPLRARQAQEEGGAAAGRERRIELGSEGRWRQRRRADQEQLAARLGRVEGLRDRDSRLVQVDLDHLVQQLQRLLPWAAGSCCGR